MDLGCHTTMNHAYPKLVNFVECEGFTQKFQDGRETTEVRPATFELFSPESSLYNGRTRRLNYRFWALETLCYLGGVGGSCHAALLTAANPHYASFLRGDQLAELTQYGPAMAAGLVEVERELLHDPSSRRAYVSLWSPRTPMHKDAAYCTTGLQFFSEPAPATGTFGLSVCAHMRSNDLNWGTPYDVPAFCAILLAMAAAVRMPARKYHHHAGSLHIYVDGPNGEHPPRLAPGLPAPGEFGRGFTVPAPPFGTPWEQTTHAAWCVCNGVHAHLKRDGKLSAYSSLGKSRSWDPSLDIYVAEWESLIRHRWDNGEVQL